MGSRERTDQHIQSRRPPPTLSLPDEDAIEDSMDVGAFFWKLIQVFIGVFAGLLFGLFLGSILGAVAGYNLEDDWAALTYGYWGGILGMAAGAIIYGFLIWKDPN